MKDPVFEVSIAFLDKNTAAIKKQCHGVDQQGLCLRMIFESRWDKEGIAHMEFVLHPICLIRKVVITELDRPVVLKPSTVIQSVAEAVKH